jgi:hypothetical protein
MYGDFTVRANGGDGMAGLGKKTKLWCQRGNFRKKSKKKEISLVGLNREFSQC